MSTAECWPADCTLEIEFEGLYMYSTELGTGWFHNHLKLASAYKALKCSKLPYGHDVHRQNVVYLLVR